ncbi:hypothetical protein J6590_006301 [Homalodisca vitripennis]|nr:hypothetical protein J6590_006301 [Homalodisca vitripennis]
MINDARSIQGQCWISSVMTVCNIEDCESYTALRSILGVSHATIQSTPIDISDIRSEDIPDIHSRDTPDSHSEDIPDIHSRHTPDIHNISDIRSEDIPDIHSRDTPDSHSEDIPDIHSRHTPDIHIEIPQIATVKIYQISTVDIPQISTVEIYQTSTPWNPSAPPSEPDAKCLHLPTLCEDVEGRVRGICPLVSILTVNSAVYVTQPVTHRELIVREYSFNNGPTLKPPLPAAMPGFPLIFTAITP